MSCRLNYEPPRRLLHPAGHFSRITLPTLARLFQTLPVDHPARVVTDDFQFRIEVPQVARSLVGIAEHLALSFEAYDLNGELYERLVASLMEAGHWGQDFTPRHVVELIVDLVDPAPTERFYDPAAGTGGFLTVAGGAARTLQDAKSTGQPAGCAR